MPDVLIYADTIRSPAMRHEVPIPVPDPFLYVERDGARHTVSTAFEVGRIAAIAGGPQAHPLEEFGYDELITSGIEREEADLTVAVQAVKGLGVESAVVPADFPLALAERLQEAGVEVRTQRETFVSRRRVKNEAELAGIRRAQRAAEAGMDAARDLLRRAEPNGAGLVVEGEPLTVERVKHAMLNAFIAHGASADEFIVAPGAQGALGHEMGHGPIPAGVPIVIDVWPKDPETGCYADMTRTFVVGEPPEEVVEYHRLVKEAVDLSLAATRAGVAAREPFRLVCEHFQAAGYPTQLSKASGEVLDHGFFHGLGHGVGPRGARAAVARPRARRPRGGRRRHARARAVPAGLRRRAARGSRARHRGRCGEADRLSVRPGAVSDATIETLLAEDRRFPPPPEFAAQANAQPDIYDLSFEELWEREGRERVTWFEPFTSLYEWEPPYAQWYLGGKLNVTYNCVDRHVEAGQGEKVAYYWEGEPGDRRELTFADLQRETTKLANALKELGVTKGTPVGIYLGMVPEAPIAMLACARIGAPHTVVFGGFSADSLRDRMQDMECEVLITQDEAWRRGTTVPLKETADEAIGRVPVGAVVRRAAADGRRRAVHGGARPLVARRGDRRDRVPVRAHGLARTFCICCTRRERPRSRRGSCTRPPATSSASPRRTATSSTSSPTRSTGARPTSAG